MRTSARPATLAGLIVGAVAYGGGSDKGVTNPRTNGKSRAARVDGAAWSAATVTTAKIDNALIISGASSTAIGISLAFLTDKATGTQGAGGTSGVTAYVTTANATWAANGAQGTATIVLTTVTATRAAGTFSFTAPLFGTAGTLATRTVTSGAFDVTY